MRYLPLLLLLASCQSWGWVDTADALMPDEFTVGQGSGEYGWAGGHLGSDPAYAYEGDIESTYAALSWDIPPIGRDESGMDRKTQRKLSVALDRLVEDEIEEKKGASESPLELNLREGVELPPPWVFYVVLGVLLLAVVIARSKAKARKRW